MEYRNLGNSGLKVSLAGLGCNNFGGQIGAEQTNAVVHRALDEGITFFDTADIYGNRGGSEELLGKALGNHRHEILLATKFGYAMGDGPYLRGASRRYISVAIEASLRRLNTDYIDLYQLHRPDPDTPQEETLAALNELVCAGKVRYLGSSNLSGWQAAEAAMITRSRNASPYISAQNEYSLLNRRIEQELIPACRHFRIGILPYFPLASGLLTGKYKKDAPPPKGTRLAEMAWAAEQMLNQENFELVERLTEFARSRGHTILELAVGWLASKPEVSSVICGATKPDQVSANVKAAEWRLTAQEMEEVNKIAQR